MARGRGNFRSWMAHVVAAPEYRTRLIAAHDDLVALAAFWAALSLSGSFQLQRVGLVEVLTYSALTVVACQFVGILTRGFHASWGHFESGNIFELLVRSILVPMALLLGIFLTDRAALIPRSALVRFGLLLFLLLLLSRLLYRAFRRARPGKPSGTLRPLLLVGAGPGTAGILEWLKTEGRNHGWYPVGILDDRFAAGRRIAGVTVLGGLHELPRALSLLRLRGERPERLLVTLGPDEPCRERLLRLQKIAYREHIPVNFLHRLLALPRRAPQAAPSQGLQPSSEDANSGWPSLRRPLDVAVAAFGLLIAAPFLAVAALGLAATLGRPVLFRQWRIGRGLVPFPLWKLRTLEDAVGPDGTVPPLEERLGRFGSWLRRLRIDELPQLVNVLLGEMALIGPRPLVVEEVEQMPQGGGLRFRVAPGLTGWAQVHGGNLLDLGEKYALDLWYVRHASPAVDLRILGRTLSMLLRGERRDEKVIAAALAELAEPPASGTAEAAAEKAA